MTLDAKTLGTKVQPSGANAKLGDFSHSHKSSQERLEREKKLCNASDIRSMLKNTYIIWLLRRTRLHRKRIWDVCAESGV